VASGLEQVENPQFGSSVRNLIGYGIVASPCLVGTIEVPFFFSHLILE
jgi:hypothetical protein